MSESILVSTKNILGLEEDYTVFDLQIITHINSTLSILSELGVGPAGGVMITDSGDKWDILELPQNQLMMVKTYLYLKVRLLFDPPGTSFHIQAMNDQIAEHEHRLNDMYQASVFVPSDTTTTEEEWPWWG